MERLFKTHWNISTQELLLLGRQGGKALHECVPWKYGAPAPPPRLRFRANEIERISKSIIPGSATSRARAFAEKTAMKSLGFYVSRRVQQFFHSLGKVVFRHSIAFFVVPLLVTLVSALGLVRFNEENRIWYLYSPSSAPSHFEHAVVTEFYQDRGGKFWLEVAITARDMGNLLRDGYLEEVEGLSNYLNHNFTVPCPHSLSPTGECSFTDLCTGPCNENQIVPLFRNNYRDPNRRRHPNFRLTYPTMRVYNEDIYVGENFAGVDVDSSHLMETIRVIVLYFRTDKKSEEVADTLESWERGIIDVVRRFDNVLINITLSSDGVVSHEVRRNGMSCVPYFSLTVVFVFCFIFATSRDRNDPDFSFADMFFVALFGTMGPLMAVGTTFGLMLLVGLPFNSITLVMPFLVIGVGCDDVFIILHAWRKTNKEDTLETRIAETMEEAGPSITLTSLTNGLSFAVGALASTPAIRLFCIYTAVGVLIDFIYQLTFFVAATVYEGHRMTRKAKIYPSKPSQLALQNAEAAKKPGAHNGIVSRYCKLLKMWQTKVLVAVTILFYWYFSIQGCLTMEIRMDSTNLILKDSPLQTTAYVYENYLWRQGMLVRVFVNDPPDLAFPENRVAMLNMVDRFETLGKAMGRNSTTFWLRSFLTNGLLDLDNPASFYPHLETWLNDDKNLLGRWNEMVRPRRENGSVVGVDRFWFSTGSFMATGTWNELAELQEEWRLIANQYKEFNVTVFQPYSFYVDQLGSIGPTTVSTVLGALGTMAVACLCLIPSYTSIASSTMAMISINVGVFGLLSQWNVSLDPITMCTTLMAIGFSVDYTAHISYHYYRNPSDWPSDVRLADALRSIGWPMIQAGASTLLSISPLAVVDSYMVSVFIKTTILVIGLGLIHGILFLPLLLLTANPTREAAAPPQAEPMPEKKFITVDDDTCCQKQSVERVLSQPLSIESQKEALSATNSV
uniref:SSD domain-containing protein n=1 Tax=Steinernema glaseri TaxID=37863 RepID=A0A1I7Y8Y4_9BILA